MEKQDNYNWKLFEDSTKRITLLTQRQGEEDDKLDKWLMSLAAGSFGLSFAFIDRIVKISGASYLPLLIAAWSDFLLVLILELVSFTASSLIHTSLAVEEGKMLELKYQGLPAEYKKRSVVFNCITLLNYASILFFIGGAVCLMVFIAKNLL